MIERQRQMWGIGVLLMYGIERWSVIMFLFCLGLGKSMGQSFVMSVRTGHFGTIGDDRRDSHI